MTSRNPLENNEINVCLCLTAVTGSHFQGRWREGGGAEATAPQPRAACRPLCASPRGIARAHVATPHRTPTQYVYCTVLYGYGTVRVRYCILPPPRVSTTTQRPVLSSSVQYPWVLYTPPPAVIHDHPPFPPIAHSLVASPSSKVD